MAARRRRDGGGDLPATFDPDAQTTQTLVIPKEVWCTWVQIHHRHRHRYRYRRDRRHILFDRPPSSLPDLGQPLIHLFSILKTTSSADRMFTFSTLDLTIFFILFCGKTNDCWLLRFLFHPSFYIGRIFYIGWICIEARVWTEIASSASKRIKPPVFGLHSIRWRRNRDDLFQP